MHVSWRFTGDGLLASFGGALALFGVWWSNHQSMKNLQQQLDEDRNVRAGNENQNRIALARIILCELDGFCRGVVFPLVNFLADKDPSTCELMVAMTPMSDAFPAYEATVAQLGQLDADLVAAVMRFYNFAWYYLTVLRNYRFWAEKYLRGESTTVRELAARRHLGNLKLGAADVLDAASLASKRLREIAGVAGDQIAILNLKNAKTN